MFRFALEPEPIHTDPRWGKLNGPEEGGVVQFFGTARRSSTHFPEKEVIRLEYEAYGPMACAEMENIFEEAKQRFGLRKAQVAHRVGRVEIGDAAVAIAVATAHRAEAFDACRYLIDELKKRVPIWKKEVYRDGSEWIGCRP